MTYIRPHTTIAGYKVFSRHPVTDAKTRPNKRARILGEKFSRLLVEVDLEKINGSKRLWGCLCDCGERIAVCASELKRGHTRSCGCLARENMAWTPGNNKLPPGSASKHSLFRSYRKGARKRKFSWGLTEEQFSELTGKDCFYCGVQPSAVSKCHIDTSGYVHNGIDRIDSAVGYDIGNVVPSCWVCNRAKGALTLNDFYVWVDRLVRFTSPVSGAA